VLDKVADLMLRRLTGAPAAERITAARDSIDAYLEWADALTAEGRLPQATAALESAAKVARVYLGNSGGEWSAAVEARTEALAARVAARPALERAWEMLAERPDDGGAHALLGLYQLTVERDPRTAAEHLAKAAHPSYAALGKALQAKSPTDLELADAYLAAARAAVSDRRAWGELLLSAAERYRLVLDHDAGNAEIARVKSALAEIKKASGGTIDPTRPTWKERATWKFPKSRLLSPYISFDGRTAAVAVREGDVRFFDVASGVGQPLDIRRDAGPKYYGAGAFSPDRRRLVFSSGTELYAIDLDERVQRHLSSIRAIGEQGDIVRLLYAPDGKSVLTLSGGGKAHDFHPYSGNESRRRWVYPLPEGEEFRGSLSPDGRFCAYYYRQSQVYYVVGLPGPREIGEGPLRDLKKPASMHFSADGRTLLVAWQDGPLVVFDTAEGRETRILRLPRKNIFGALLTPDGRTAVLYGGFPEIALVDLNAGVERTLPAFPGGCSSVVLSRDGRTLAAAGPSNVLYDAMVDREVKVWTLSQDGLRRPGR
jgi:hypothetical protein